MIIRKVKENKYKYGQEKAVKAGFMDIKAVKINMDRKKVAKASFTIEAAFIIPLALFTIMGGIQIGYDMYKQARTASEIHEELQELNPVKIVRKNTLIHEMIEEHK